VTLRRVLGVERGRAAVSSRAAGVVRGDRDRGDRRGSVSHVRPFIDGWAGIARRVCLGWPTGPRGCGPPPAQTPPDVEALICELRRNHPSRVPARWCAEATVSSGCRSWPRLISISKRGSVTRVMRPDTVERLVDQLVRRGVGLLASPLGPACCPQRTSAFALKLPRTENESRTRRRVARQATRVGAERRASTGCPVHPDEQQRRRQRKRQPISSGWQRRPGGDEADSRAVTNRRSMARLSVASPQPGENRWRQCNEGPRRAPDAGRHPGSRRVRTTSTIWAPERKMVP
jgi:hypothetical protein